MILAALLACAHHDTPIAPPPKAGLVEVARTSPAVPERQAVLRVLAGAQPVACYEAALARNPAAYGEVVVRFTIGAAGLVDDAAPQFSTLADDVAERCVADSVRRLQFPAPSRPGLTVVYPFLFTSDGTPPEVARALKVRYGLLSEDVDADLTDPKAEPPPGVVLVW